MSQSQSLSKLKSAILFFALSFAATGCLNKGNGGIDVALGLNGGVGDSAFASTPTSYDFGTIAVNSTASTTMILRNSAAQSVAIGGFTLNSPQYSIVSDNCPRSPTLIAKGASCAVTISFTPTTSGLMGVALKVSYGVDSNSSNTYSTSFGLSGSGASPLIFAGLQSIDTVTHNSMTLRWTANAQATSYILFRVVGVNLIYHSIVLNTSGTVDNKVISGLTPSTPYIWRVRGVDVLGNSDANTSDVAAITTANVSPVLAALGAQTLYQGTAWSVNSNEITTGNDTDTDGDAIAYSCYYDTTVDGVVGTTNACTTLLNEGGTNATLDTSTGLLSWTPAYAVVAGTQFEMKITGVDPYSGSSSRIFVSTVNQGTPITAHSPAGHLTFPTNFVSTTTSLNLDFYNSRSGTDAGVDSFACVFDRVVDSVVAAGTACTSLPGTATFNTTTGALSWTPSAVAWGPYEVKVTATNPAGSHSDFVTVDVRQPITATNLIGYWDASFADGTKFGSNSPLTTTLKDLTTASTTYDGTLSNFGALITSGWSNASIPKLVFDAVNDVASFGTVFSSPSSFGIEFWLRPLDRATSTIWTFADASNLGLTLKQSVLGDGKLELIAGQKSYIEEVLADNPDAFYRLNEPSGTIAYSIAPVVVNAAYNGTVTKAVTGAIADNDKGVSFNGSTSSLNIPIAVGATTTIEVWASLSNLGSTPMLWRTGPNGTGPDLFFASGVISLNTWDSASNPFCAVPAAATDGALHHYVTVIDSGTSSAKLYFDGTLCGSAVYRNPSATSYSISANLGSYEWAGAIDEVAVYSTPLSAARVLAHYNAKSRLTCRTPGSIAKDVWHNTFATFDNPTSTLKLYVNGQSQCSVTGSTGTSGSPASLAVGAGWNGELAEMRAYSSSSAAPVTANFAATKDKLDSFIPLAGLRLWLRADAMTKFINNDKVPFWEDQSVAGNHALQAVVGRQPVFETSVINSLPALKYTGGSACLVTQSNDLLSAHTAFVVFKDDGIAQSYERLLDKDYANGFWLGRDNVSVNGWESGYKESAPPYGALNTFNDTLPHIATTWHSGTTHTIYADGANPSSTVVSNTATSAAPYGIGCWYNDSGSQALGGWIAEVLVYNTALSSADRLRVERYLGAKYGITVP